MLPPKHYLDFLVLRQVNLTETSVAMLKAGTRDWQVYNAALSAWAAAMRLWGKGLRDAAAAGGAGAGVGGGGGSSSSMAGISISRKFSGNEGSSNITSVAVATWTVVQPEVACRGTCLYSTSRFLLCVCRPVVRGAVTTERPVDR